MPWAEESNRAAYLPAESAIAGAVARSWHGCCLLYHVMIAWGLRIHVSSGKRDEVHRIFRSLLEPTRVRGGCLACRAYQDTEDPEVLALIQEWASSDDLERYLRSENFRKLVAAMELASERPEIWFDTIETREGFERLSAGLSTVDPERP